MQNISAIVLAAGLSSRMGRNKLMIPFGESTVIRHVVSVLAEAGLGEIVVVTGHEAGLVQGALEGLPCRFVLNESFREGMGSSISSGVRAASPDAEGFLIVLGDMPYLNSILILQVGHIGQTGRIVVPRHGGRWGNPVLFGAKSRGELESLSGDIGARDILLRHADRLLFVEAESERTLEDIDLPSDMQS